MHTFTIHYCPTYSAVPLNFYTTLHTTQMWYLPCLDIYLENLQHFLTFCRLKIFCCCFIIKDTLIAAESVVSGRVYLNVIPYRHSQLCMFFGCLATGG